MKVFGDTIDPGKLNAWMKGKDIGNSEAGGYTSSGGVSWQAPREHSERKILIDWDYYEEPREMIIKKIRIVQFPGKSKSDTIIENVINHEGSFDKSVLDAPLSRCCLMLFGCSSSLQ